MIFETTAVSGVFLIKPEPIADDRGYFARIWCADEFDKMNLTTRIVQTNMSMSLRKGTLRGLHYQREPRAEVKVVRCPRGAIFDVTVDLRPNSPTYRQWVGVELNQDNGFMLYVPEGCAQGLLTLEDHTEIYYHTSCTYSPDAAMGVRFNDPIFGIEWPERIQYISDQDRNWPDFPD